MAEGFLDFLEVGSAMAVWWAPNRFDDGHLLKVAPDPQYEAWTASGPDGMLVVSVPGGDLAVWSPRS